MIWILKLLHRFFKVLNSEESPSMMAWGLTIGLLWGVTPFSWLYSSMLFLALVLFNVHFSAGILGLILGKLLSFILDPLFHLIGWLFLIKFSFLEPVWAFLYNLPLIPLSNFNNTVSFGAMFLGLLGIKLIFKGQLFLLTQYRARLKPKLEKNIIFKSFKASKLVGWYSKVVR